VLVQLLAPALLNRVLSSDEVYNATWTYLNIRIWGIFFSFLGVMFRALYIGILKPAMLSWAAAIIAVVNIILAFLLIFGFKGFPPMGIAGAALASVIAEATGVVFLLAATLLNKFRANYGIYKFGKPDTPLRFRSSPCCRTSWLWAAGSPSLSSSSNPVKDLWPFQTSSGAFTFL
jgi:Na+-driven multidrug efflux pump